MICDVICLIAKYSEFIYQIRLKKCNKILHTRIKIYDIKVPKILKKIRRFSYSLTNEILKNYPDLKVLNLSCNEAVTDEGIKHLNLYKLNLSDNEKITDEGIRHMDLRVLKLRCMSGITNNGIQHLRLRELDILFNEDISYSGIKNMELEVLKFTPFNDTEIFRYLNKSQKHMKLYKLSIYDYEDGSTYISNDCINHLRLHTLIISSYKIWDEAIKDMKLYKLCIGCLTRISDIGIRNMFLHTLKINNEGISNEGINHMKLNTLKLGFLSKTNITHLSDNHKNLRNLEIRNCPGIRDEDIKDLKLEVLSIGENITDKGIQNMNLKKFSTSDNITNEGLKNMNLTYLTITNNNINDDGIKHMNKLKILHIIQNEKITHEGIKNLDLIYLGLYKGDNNFMLEDLKCLGLVKIENEEDEYIVRRYSNLYTYSL